MWWLEDSKCLFRLFIFEVWVKLYSYLVFKLNICSLGLKTCCQNSHPSTRKITLCSPWSGFKPVLWFSSDFKIYIFIISFLLTIFVLWVVSSPLVHSWFSIMAFHIVENIFTIAFSICTPLRRKCWKWYNRFIHITHL